ncbi:MAG: hypothetical protein ACLRJC_09650 [Emergencia timonensis]|uniref:hypothetical protein n=1 Tax=Emergencia timonensis TaxID=1776384 RepID=UPI0008351D8D|nr:hypothetical protein [Emergencia timonensis]WNX90269.1 hypothetical protein RVY71_08305 [Emergencia timonensis]
MDSDTKNLEKAMKALQTDEQIEDYLCCQQEDGEIKYFYQYLHQIADAKRIPMSQVVARSKVNRNYVYNITGGVKRNPGRDKIIALCIGACMNYEETNKALEIGGYCRLNPKDERDVRIAVAINTRKHDVVKINESLIKNDLQPLKI